MADAFREEQEFYQSLVERGVVTHDEAALLKRVLPLALVRKLLGERALSVGFAGAVKHEVVRDALKLLSPDGSVWRLTINNDGKARTEKVKEN